MLRAPLRNSLLHIKYSDSVMAISLFQLVSSDFKSYDLKIKPTIKLQCSIIAFKCGSIVGKT